MVKVKDSIFVITAIYLTVILAGMVSAYLFLVNFQSRTAEKNPAAKTQNDAQGQEAKGGKILFMAPRAEDVIHNQEAE